MARLLYSVKQRMRPTEELNKDPLHSTERGYEKASEAGLVPTAVPLDAGPTEVNPPTNPLPPQSGIIPQSFPIPAAIQPTPRQVVTSAEPIASPFSPVFTSPLVQVPPWTSCLPLRPPPHQGHMSSSSRLSLTPMTTMQPLQPNAGGAISATILDRGRGSSLSTPAAKPVDPSNQRRDSIRVSHGQESTVGEKRPSERTGTEQSRAPPQLRTAAAPSEDALATYQSVNTLPIPSDRPIADKSHMVSPGVDLDPGHDVPPDLKRPWQYTGQIAPGLDLYLAQLVLHELVDLSLYRSDGTRLSAADPAGAAIRGPRGGRRGGHTTSTDYPAHEGDYLRDTAMGSDVGYGSRQYTGGYDPDEHQARDEGCGGRWWSWGTEFAFISD